MGTLQTKYKLDDESMGVAYFRRNIRIQFFKNEFPLS